MEENEDRFILNVESFPPASRPGIAQAIVEQGNAQVGPGSVNAVLDKNGAITVILTPGPRWLHAAGFQAAVTHWLESH
jgi:hypothetical protein